MNAFSGEASSSIWRTNLSSSAQLMTLSGIGNSMFKCMFAGSTRTFSDMIRFGDSRVGYGRENVWRYKSADRILLDLFHDGG